MRRLSALFLILFLSASSPIFARLGANATIQNIHLWRGGKVADGFVLTTDLYYTNSSEQLRIGLWGGMNGVGEYEEFNHYISYKIGGLSLTLTDTYNFSTYATYNNEEYFNYVPDETGRFLDAALRYQFEGRFPIKLTWATVLYGRDRDDQNQKNRYSTFCGAEYMVYNADLWRVDIGVGCAFSFVNVGSSANFYGSEAGLVEISMKVSRSLYIKEYEMPLYIMGMWNPQSNKAYLQLSAQVLTF